MTQFANESNWDSIVNDESLDVEEEESFERFVIEHGGNRNMPLAELLLLFSTWQEFRFQ